MIFLVYLRCPCGLLITSFPEQVEDEVTADEVRDWIKIAELGTAQAISEGKIYSICPECGRDLMRTKLEAGVFDTVWQTMEEAHAELSRAERLGTDTAAKTVKRHVN